ncbi:SLATT domain-containing protein [Sporosarcina sp. BI001-red]|uniref:SLATT domain-containing protein n=1 Tax=Sporosarcina sp. BI001-red TaxID=2282866 RepID=UPI000E226480|nr:SLATT domain-containing protein [Sporosarcina sp. BI001-red]REB08863.1 SLATT domain-containing protein [Sporosarcina sp. BI001-red]
MKDYKNITLESEIVKKINSFNKTRENRIEMSKRLKKYNNQWQFIFFFLNIEAVAFILLSIGGMNVNNLFGSQLFIIYTGIFSIYVILLQYYVSCLNYNERALKLHYHQLEIEDQILKLKELIINSKELEKGGDYRRIEIFNSIMYKYQLSLKNNENHKSIDFRIAESNNTKRKSEDNNTNNDSEKEIKTNKFNISTVDKSLDNILVKINMLFIFIAIGLIYFL